MAIILIVEDNQLVRKSLIYWLEKSNPQCDFMEFDRGEGAISYSKNNQIDIIIIDVHLPGINGIEAARKILITNPATQIIVTSIVNDLKYYEESIQAGAKFFIPKQDLYRDLDSAIKELSC